MRDGYVIDHSPISLANTFNWPTLGVVRYRNDLKLIDDALSLQVRLEKHLLGVVINGLSRGRGYYDAGYYQYGYGGKGTSRKGTSPGEVPPGPAVDAAAPSEPSVLHDDSDIG